MTEAAVDFGTTRDGLRQLRRRWMPDGGARAAMLLLHGIGEHSGRYDHVGKFLAAEGIDVVAIDHRGHGESGGRRLYVERFDDYLVDVQDQMAQVRKLGLPTILLGHSMGGLIATAYAESSRPQPDLLVLSGPALGAEVPVALRAAAQVFGRVAPALRFTTPIDGTILSTDPAVGEAYFADELVVVGATARLGAELFAAGRAVTAALDQLRIPTLVQHGLNDRLVPADASSAFEGLRGVTRITYPGMEHEVYNEVDKAVVLNDLLRWLNQNLANSSDL